MSTLSVVLSTKSCAAYCRKARNDSRRSVTYERDRATPLLLSGFRALQSSRPCICTVTRIHSLQARTICMCIYWEYLHAHVMCCTQRRWWMSSINWTIIKIGWINVIGMVRLPPCIFKCFEYLLISIRSQCVRYVCRTVVRETPRLKLGELFEKWDRYDRIKISQ